MPSLVVKVPSFCPTMTGGVVGRGVAGCWAETESCAAVRTSNRVARMPESLAQDPPQPAIDVRPDRPHQVVPLARKDDVFIRPARRNQLIEDSHRFWRRDTAVRAAKQPEPGNVQTVEDRLRIEARKSIER